MGYTPTEWHTGDTITEEKLNNIEAGIADGGLPKNIQITQTIFDGTYPFSGDEGGPYGSDDIPSDKALVVGNTYTVTFDGTEYSCVCDYFPPQDVNYIGYADVLDGEAGDYPFFIGYYTDVYAITTTSSESSHSVKLEQDIAGVQPGTAMIFDGTKWTQQSGYGYVAAGQTISWDGDGTGRDSFLLNGITYYKVSDIIIEDFSAWAVSIDGETQTIAQNDGTNCVAAVMSPSELIVLSLSDTSAEFSGDSITAPSVGTYMHSPATLQRPGEVQVFDDKFISVSTPTNVFDVNDAPELPEIAEAYNKYGTVYLRIDQDTVATGIPIYTRYGLTRFEFPTKMYTLNGESGNSTITLEFRFYSNTTGFKDRSNPQTYTIPLTWVGQ